ncbi:hypothetical protein SNE40_002686 [Patella caerulea]|uniref:Uncharacterized protein n=1 Tax=Patella caerulea TaxID=87958 RepID=A0AAN8KCD4_PATCE
MAEKSEKKVLVVHSATDLQRLKLEKLMKNPNKEVFIPDKPKDSSAKKTPEFIRNVWGSSAGAGSGDFHVYRGVRRREYARQKFNAEKAKREELDAEFSEKVKKNQTEAEKKAAKKRAKRLKKKQRQKAAKKLKSGKQEEESEEESEDEDDEEENKQDAINDSNDVKDGDSNINKSKDNSSDSDDDSDPKKVKS